MPKSTARKKQIENNTSKSKTEINETKVGIFETINGLHIENNNFGHKIMKHLKVLV